MSTDSLESLRSHLYTLFQFDVADLDFGIYRILNEKRDEIERFIEEDLVEGVREELRAYEEGQAEALREEVDEARQAVLRNISEDAIQPDGTVREEYRNTKAAQDYIKAQERLESAELSDETERRIYDDLARFFNRYYDNGDFVTKRRFAAGNSKYVVPYDGEEVLLHWANRDQYYVKTTEHFRDYRFTVRDVDVHFKLVDAQTPQDNVKASDTRYFVLHGEDPVDVDPEEQHCTIRFAYRPITEDEDERLLALYNEQQAKSDRRKTNDRSTIVKATTHQVLDAIDDATVRANLAQPEEGKEKSPLHRHLNRYTAKNTADYFVHKDLASFLREQLDFFIQNEVLALGEVLEAEEHRRLHQVDRAKAVKKIGERIIDFLAQIENFQKRLFEKKKFVVDTGYCVTLDRVPEELYDAILENDDQLDEWRDIYAVDEWDNDLFSQGYEDGTFTQDFLEAHPHVMIDTKHFKENQNFIDTLLFHLSTLDEEEGLSDVVDGLCIQGENFQALNLLQERFREKIQCVYIDPPYNTDATPILYKNGFRSSSWLTMLYDRLRLHQSFAVPKSGVTCVAIDDHELANLSKLLRRVFGQSEIHRVVVNHYPGSGTGRSNVTRTHEYALFVVPEGEDVLRGEKKEEGIRERLFRRSGTGENNYRTGRPNSFYAVLVDDDEFKIKGLEPPPEQGEQNYPTDRTEEGWLRIYPIGEDGSERVWTLSYESARDKWKKHGDHILYCNSNLTIKRLYYDEGDRDLLQSLWTGSEFSAASYGTNLLTDLFGESGLFSYPKSIYTVQKAIEAISHNEKYPTVLDYFAGSGTTGHAVMNMNRDDEVDGNDGKYVLVEMGEYFDTVLLPRLKKVAFSSEWKDGVPQGNDGMSHVIQYHRLESYEDALNNIEVKQQDTELSLLDRFDDYALRYMLPHETQESETLLAPDAFERPFEYTLRIQQGMESPKAHAVDLEATFNYLIGLQVQTRCTYTHQDRRYVVVTGTVEQEQSIDTVMVVWRNQEALDLDAEKEWAAEALPDGPFDTVYVNGPSFIHGKAEPLEITFRERMDPAAG